MAVPRSTTIKKYKRIQDRFSELYDQERKRYDDIVEILMREFFMEKWTIQYALRQDISELEEKREVGDPSQTKLFPDE